MEDYLHVLATLCYQRYPGSGTNLRPPDVANMEWGRILWWYQWLQDRWEEESQALKKSSKS